MIWGRGLFCSNNNMTYLPWNIPVFQKMIFYFQRRVSASYKSCNAELGRKGILRSKHYLPARVEAAVGVFVLAWQFYWGTAKLWTPCSLRKRQPGSLADLFPACEPSRFKNRVVHFKAAAPWGPYRFLPSWFLTFNLTLPAFLQKAPSAGLFKKKKKNNEPLCRPGWLQGAESSRGASHLHYVARLL